MMAAAFPVLESRRLESLQSYKVLDTPEEAAFDELVQLASHICEVLGHLKRFKINKLKIDQSFVHDIAVDPDDRAIVTAIVSLAQNLGIETIAEGVETQEQLDFLRQQGCNHMQGYHLSRPLPAGEALALIRRFVPVPTTQAGAPGTSL